MYSFQPTTGWQSSAVIYSDSNPIEMGLLLANLMRYSAQLNACRDGVRPQMEGLTEEDMEIVSIKQLSSPVPNLLIAYVYPDPDHRNRLATMIIIGKELEKNADMEYVKRCVTAHLN